MESMRERVYGEYERKISGKYEREKEIWKV